MPAWWTASSSFVREYRRSAAPWRSACYAMRCGLRVEPRRWIPRIARRSRVKLPGSIAARLAGVRGIGIRHHLAEQVGPRRLRRYALLLTMEQAPPQLVDRTQPPLDARAFRRGLAHNFDVPDPYGQDEPKCHESLAAIDEWPGYPAAKSGN